MKKDRKATLRQVPKPPPNRPMDDEPLVPASGSHGNYLWEVITRIPDPRDESGKSTMEAKAYYVAWTPEQVWAETATDRMDERTEFVGIFRTVPVLKVIHRGNTKPSNPAAVTDAGDQEHE